VEKLLRDKELKFYSFNYLFICNFWRINGQIPHKTVCLSWRNFRTSHTWSRFANHFTSTLTIKPVYPKTGKQMKNESQVTTLTYASAVICHCCPYGYLGLQVLQCSGNKTCIQGTESFDRSSTVQGKQPRRGGKPLLTAGCRKPIVSHDGRSSLQTVQVETLQTRNRSWRHLGLDWGTVSYNLHKSRQRNFVWD
jgi:hypothetical protein